MERMLYSEMEKDTWDKSTLDPDGHFFGMVEFGNRLCFTEVGLYLVPYDLINEVWTNLRR